MYNHNKAQQSKNRVHISWDILYVIDKHFFHSPLWRIETFGKGAFSKAAPTPWNLLPFSMKQATYIGPFKIRLKTDHFIPLHDYTYIAIVIVIAVAAIVATVTIIIIINIIILIIILSLWIVNSCHDGYLLYFLWKFKSSEAGVLVQQRVCEANAIIQYNGMRVKQYSIIRWQIGMGRRAFDWIDTSVTRVGAVMCVGNVWLSLRFMRGSLW